MQTVEIPRDEWPQALREFSAVHEGWLISIDILSSAIGAQPEVRDLPLVGVVAEPGDRGGTISIAAAKSRFEQFTHVIHSPARVSLERTEEGADVALQIEWTDGTRSIVRFTTPALPETVDGLPKP